MRSQSLPSIFLVMLVAVLLVACGNAANSPSTPSLTPTTVSQATSTPTTQSVQSGAITLGQPLSHFIAKYGPANDHSTVSGGLYHFQRYAGSNLDFLIIQSGIAEGIAYANLVESITVQSPEGGWTTAKADSTCAAFLPPDAVYQSQVQLANGDYDKIYFSTSLATLFPASAFTDADQNPAKPGTFDVQYIVQGQSVVACSVQVGTQQTK